MPPLPFDAAVLGLLSACELLARWAWPELFAQPAPEQDGEFAPEDGVEDGVEDEEHRDEMAVW